MRAFLSLAVEPPLRRLKSVSFNIWSTLAQIGQVGANLVKTPPILPETS